MNWTSKTLNSSNCSNDDFKFPVFIHSYSVILSIGLIGNAVALYVFVKLTHRKTASTVFMINLAISDLFFTLTLPYRILYYSQREWKLGSFLCRITTYAFYVNLYSSIFFLMALSIFRYIAVLHPLRSKSLVTLRRALLVSLGIWIFVGLACIPFLRSSSQLKGGTYRCFEPTVMNWQQILKMNYFALVVGFLFPFLTIIACYTRIIQRLRTSGGMLQRNVHARRKSIYMIVFVLSSFLFCFLPYHIIRTVHLHLMVQQQVCQVITIVIEKVIVVTICLAAANSCINPLLYYFVGQNFQNTIKTSTVHRSRSISSRTIVSQ